MLKPCRVVVDDGHALAGAVLVDVGKCLRTRHASLERLLELLPIKLAAAFRRSRDEIVQLALHALKALSALLRRFRLRSIGLRQQKLLRFRQP